MAGCNCKNKDEVNIPFKNSELQENKESLLNLIPIYGIKLFGFFIGLLLLPIIIGAIIVFMFKIIVLTREIDIRPLFNSMVKLMKTSDEEEDDDEDDDDDNENDVVEYIMMDVEDISKKE
jgi:hypothetical protein